jgi:error-prone DNA polymerase
MHRWRPLPTVGQEPYRVSESLPSTHENKTENGETSKSQVTKPRPLLRNSREFAEGLLCLTGDIDGPLAVALRRGDGRACLEKLNRTFGRGKVFVELQRHHDRDEEARNQEAIRLSRSLQLPLVATNGVCHVQKAQRQIRDVFTCLHHKTTSAAAGRLLTKNAERHLKFGVEMTHLFADHPEAIFNTAEISS